MIDWPVLIIFFAGFLPSPPGKQENPSGPAFPPQSPSQPSIPLPVAQPEQDSKFYNSY